MRRIEILLDDIQLGKIIGNIIEQGWSDLSCVTVDKSTFEFQPVSISPAPGIAEFKKNSETWGKPKRYKNQDVNTVIDLYRNIYSMEDFYGDNRGKRLYDYFDMIQMALFEPAYYRVNSVEFNTHTSHNTTIIKALYKHYDREKYDRVMKVMRSLKLKDPDTIDVYSEEKIRAIRYFSDKKDFDMNNYIVLFLSNRRRQTFDPWTDDDR